MAVTKASLARNLVGAHQIAAYWFQAPILAISEEEAKQLAEPIQAIADYYGLTMGGPWLLWTNLVTVVAMIYGPRLVLLMSEPASQPTHGHLHGVPVPEYRQ